MFTGLIQTVGQIGALQRTGSDFELRVDSDLPVEQLELGESIAVNGACLTVIRCRDQGFYAQASQETLRRTNLGDLKVGSAVNLERAMRLGDRLGGHLVLGHVDGVGNLRSFRREGNATHVEVGVPRELMPYLLEKGSIAMDGISLTVNELFDDGFSVAIVPWTSGKVALLDRPLGWRINLEVDVLGKYVARLLSTGRIGGRDGITLDKLAEHGFLDPNEL